jgi:hypothetical protein
MRGGSLARSGLGTGSPSGKNSRASAAWQWLMPIVLVVILGVPVLSATAPARI